MVRYTIVVISALIYVAFAASLVTRQGEAYREKIRRDRTVRNEGDKPTTQEPEPKAAIVDEPDSKGEPIAADTSKMAGTEIDEQQSNEPATSKHKNKQAREKTKQRRQTAENNPNKNRSKVQPAESTVAPETPKPSSGTTAPSAGDPLAGNPFWTQPEMMRTWDVSDLSAADEQKLGAQLHDVIVQLNPVAEDGQLQQRVEEAAKPFLARLNHKEIRYHFVVLQSGEVNAFSHPGGYVYVSRGLFDLVGEDEDYALQFALGNEIAHVDLHHAIKCLQDPDVKAMTGGTIRKLYWVIIPLGYLVTDSVNQDYEADEWTATRMRSFGRSKRETLAFLNKLDGYAKKHGFGDGRGKARMGTESASFLDIHYRRQTAAWRRLANLKEKIK